jgi:hypothetical protein
MCERRQRRNELQGVAPRSLARTWLAGWWHALDTAPVTSTTGEEGMHIRSRLRSVGACIVGFGTAAVMLASPALAASGQQTVRESFDPTGDVFTCMQGDLTITGGTVYEVLHFGEDARGIFHYTSTITVKGVTATDANGNQYFITGALRFGGKAVSENENLLETDTSHFVIHNASGGVYAQVQVVDHFSLNGRSFTFDIGGCETPND